MSSNTLFINTLVFDKLEGENVSKELAKAYEPKEVEDRIYDFWMKGKYFHAR